MPLALKRSRFLAGVGGTAAVPYVRQAAGAAQFEYRLGLSDAVGVPREVRMTQMAKAIEKETNGRLRIQVFPNSLLGSTTSMLTQLREGGIQFFLSLAAIYTTVVPVAAIDSVGFAFTSARQPWEALDGPLGAYIRKEFAAKNIYAFEHVIEAGFRQMTTSNKPIRTADDFVGLKMRTPPARIFVDLFRTLGASPVALETNELYTSLQTHVVDGQELPLDAIAGFRLYEVQRFLSMTNHVWGGSWLTANMENWNALPDDVQKTVQRNATKYTLLERNDALLMNSAVADKLRRQGLVMNVADTASMRARLGPYYARWKDTLGRTAWSLLEDKVGKLG